MSPTETLMWLVERDPTLRSSFMTVTMLERPPDAGRFRQRMAAAATTIPRLRQRVVDPALGVGPPQWADDPYFDIDYHVRRVAVPAPGSERQLLDLAALSFQDDFDHARPLWQYTIVEGLEGGRAALLAKMHHTISDGVGALRLSTMFVDVEPNPSESADPANGADPHGQAEPTRSPPLLDRLAHSSLDALRMPVNLTRRTLAGMAHSVSQPSSIPDEAGNVLQTANAALRQLRPADASRSPLWTGRRSMVRRFEVLSVELDAAKQAATKLGGTLNDLYVAGILGGAAAYHRQLGAPVDTLRVAVPINTRTDRSAGGNAFLPNRMLLPADIEDPVERFAAVHRRMTEAKGEHLSGLADVLATVAARLPPSVILGTARSQVESVDFVASNLRGAPFPLYIAGARIVANYPMGPTAGTAFNATLLSYQNSLDIGINIDAGAVSEPELLKASLVSALDEQIAAG